MKHLTIMQIITIGLLLSGCGGGGGGGGGGSTATPNSPPTADAGPDQDATENTSVQLAGAGSDPEGSALSFTWSQVSGPAVTFSSTADASPTIDVPLIAVGTTEAIVLQLSVADAQGASATDQITINAASADFVVFHAAKDTAGVFELYKYDAETGVVDKLSGVLVAGGSVSFNYAMSPDGQQVAYIADQEVDNVIELFIAAVDGSGVTKANAPLVAGGAVSRFTWAPDSSQIAYQADGDTEGVLEVYLVDRDGSNPTKINGNTAGSVFLNDVKWSPDSRYVAQGVFENTASRFIGINTHDTDAGVSNSVRINPALPGTQSIVQYSWSPDSTRISYTAFQDSATELELYVANPDGTGNTKINGDLVLNGFVIQHLWAPDSSHIAYLATQTTTAAFEIFAARADGTDLAQINRPLGTGGATGDIRWAPDSSRISYRIIDDSATGEINLDTALPDGTDNTRVNPVLIAGGTIFFYEWLPDSSQIVYQASQDTVNVFELYAGAPDGSGNVKVSGPMVSGGSVAFFGVTDSISPDGNSVVYHADQLTDGVTELFVSSIDGLSNAEVSRTPVMSGSVGGVARWSSDSSRVAYIANQDTASVAELYLATPDGMSNMSISGPIVAGGFVTQYSWSP